MKQQSGFIKEILRVLSYLYIAMKQDRIRYWELDRERKIQISNNGIRGIFFRGGQFRYPCFQLLPEQISTLKEWLGDKYAINIYDSRTFQQILTINGGENSYLQDCYIYLTSPKKIRYFQQGEAYIFAKNNATIAVLSKVFQELHKINDHLQSFISIKDVCALSPNPIKEYDWYYEGFNPRQREAVQKVVKNRITFIKGPPGCGKTTVLSRICRIFGENNKKVLVGAVSKSANLALTRKLVNETSFFKSQVSILLYVLKQTKAENSAYPPQIRNVTLRIRIIKQITLLSQNQTYHWDQRQVQFLLDLYWTNKQTDSTFIRIYFEAMAKIFRQTDVVIVTTISTAKLDKKLKEEQTFKPYIGILDESSQASWANTYCFLVKEIKKFVLAGDDKQLSPVVISQSQILKETMFSTLHKKNSQYFTLLNEQHRMHPQIAQFPNKFFYQNQLIDAVTSEERISQIPYFKKYPLSYVKVTENESEEINLISQKKNYWNLKQIGVILEILTWFHISDYSKIGIISPYDLQIKEILKRVGNQALMAGLTVRTVDGYQGGEKDYIIVSLVRSNKQCKIGFCEDEARLNVTLTRAKRGIVVIGNSDTFQNSSPPSKMWSQYIKYLREKKLIFESHEFYSLTKHSEDKMTTEKKKQTMEIKRNSNNAEIIYQKPKRKIQDIQIIDCGDDQEERLFNKNKPLKKKLKYLINKYSNAKIKLSLNSESEKNKGQMQNSFLELAQIIDLPIPNPQEKLTKQMYLECKDHEEDSEFFSEKLKKEFNQIIEEIKKIEEFNHLKEKQLVFRFIKVKILISYLDQIK